MEKTEEKDKHSAKSRVPELASCGISSVAQLLKYVEACYHYQSDSRGRAFAVAVTFTSIIACSVWENCHIKTRSVSQHQSPATAQILPLLARKERQNGK